VDLESLLPDVWIAAHPEHFLAYRREEAEAAALARVVAVAPDGGRKRGNTAEAPEMAGVLD
jgi:hypothetical protein